MNIKSSDWRTTLSNHGGTIGATVGGLGGAAYGAATGEGWENKLRRAGTFGLLGGGLGLGVGYGIKKFPAGLDKLDEISKRPPKAKIDILDYWDAAQKANPIRQTFIDSTGISPEQMEAGEAKNMSILRGSLPFLGKSIPRLPNIDYRALAVPVTGGLGLLAANRSAKLVSKLDHFSNELSNRDPDDGSFKGIRTAWSSAKEKARSPLGYLYSQIKGKPEEEKEEIKQADLLPSVALQPHQEQLKEDATNVPQRILLYHGLGSGKTLSSIGMAEAQGKPYTAIVPASLRNNYRKEREKFTDEETPADVMSYTSIARGDPVDKLHTLVFDESQRLRNQESKQTQRALDLADKAKQVILLSGTPITNRASELAPVINMLTGRRMSSDEFTGRYVGESKKWPGLVPWLRGVQPVTEQHINNKDELKALLEGHIDYYHPSQSPVPVNRKDVPVEMGPEQTRLYKAMWNELPWVMKWKLKNDFPMSNNELQKTLSFLNGPRQVSLSTYPYLRNKDYGKAFDQSTKLQTAHKNLTETLQDPRKKALIFSNFIDAGLNPYANRLTKDKVPNAVFHGGLNDEARKKLVDDYNNDRIRVALLGPSGAEGLSFKGTNLVQLLDSHWNSARPKQMEGRAIRHDSHLDVDEDLKNVEVQRYISKLPPGLKARLLSLVGRKPEPGKASDDYLIAMSQRKDDLNQQFVDLLKELGSKKRF